jgi:hypothetical protein
MAMAVDGTFDYVFDVDADLRTAHIRGRLRDPIPANVRPTRLVGHAPNLSAVEYQREAWQLYARFTLVASDPHNAAVSQAWFSVHRGLLDVLRRGDVLHLNRTFSAGLGLSILRENLLVAAAGAITGVPLGSDASARIPYDLVRQAESAFRTRDVDYQMGDQPVELTIAGQTAICHSGRRQIGPYDVFIRHGFLSGFTGTNESASIERRGVCPETTAHTSAELIECEDLEFSR